MSTTIGIAGVFGLLLSAFLGVAFLAVVIYAIKKKAWVSLVCMLVFVPIAAGFLIAIPLAAPARVASNGGIRMTVAPPSQSVGATASAEGADQAIVAEAYSDYSVAAAQAEAESADCDDESTGQIIQSYNTEAPSPAADRRGPVGRAVEQTSWRTPLSVAFLAGLLVIAYLFLDANTRGHYTWPLRVGSAIAFAAICVFLWRAGPLF
ncbi:MAG: hypothetical protein O7F76_00595 [Planctomycetota bacterium]|nr:hypothetical protein [Planctomycetota bacterium]